MSASIPADQLIKLPVSASTGHPGYRAQFPTAIVKDSPFSGDEFVPIGGVTSEGAAGMVLLPDGTEVCAPTPRSQQGGGVIADVLSRAAFYLMSISPGPGGDQNVLPPQVRFEVRCGFGNISQVVFSGRLIPEGYTSTVGKGLLVKLDHLPLCNQIELWAIAVPDDDNPAPSVSLRINIFCDRDGGGQLEPLMGSMVVADDQPEAT